MCTLACSISSQSRVKMLVAFLLTVFALADECPSDINFDASLKEVVENDDLQFIFVGGKGGVGKTTTSSSLAIQLAKHRTQAGGKPVLLISTDPAHSLGDAFRMEFDGNPKEIPGAPGLYVMETDPAAVLEKEIKGWAKMAKEAGMDKLITEVQKFQEWLTSIPGIDEATALSSVIGHIKKGDYSAIVFDTAPTGHTLKLLQLPDVLEAGISKLQSWQSQLWSYYELFTAFGKDPKNKNKSDPTKLRKKLEKKLKKYKKGIVEVGKMLKDNQHTTFIPVCIAEYLSISETQRLLRELTNYKIHKAHVVVNQLMMTGFSDEELKSKLQPEKLRGAGFDVDMAARISTATTLINSRHNIQSKYLKMLKESEDAKCMDIVLMPLLGKEVTGAENLSEFSRLLVKGSATTGSSSKDEL